MGTFPDVPPTNWAFDDIEWSAERGIFEGYENGTFGPGDPLTRAQAAAVLRRTVRLIDPELAERNPPPTGWGDAVPYGTRPASEPIHWSNVDSAIIHNLDFRDVPYQFDGTNGHVGILLDNCSNITITNCDFTNMGQPIAIVNGGHNIVVEYNRCNGITGPSDRHDVQTGNFIQTVGAPNLVTVGFNKILGGDTEDIISSFSAIDMWIHHNQIDGTGWTSRSGTGIICGDGGGARVTVEHNTLLNPGQVGVAVAGGIDHIVRNNVVYSNHAAENVGMYHHNYYPGLPFGGTHFADNRVRFVSNSNGFWAGTSGFTESANVWDDHTINPADLAVVL